MLKAGDDGYLHVRAVLLKMGPLPDKLFPYTYTVDKILELNPLSWMMRAPNWLCLCMPRICCPFGSLIRSPVRPLTLTTTVAVREPFRFNKWILSPLYCAVMLKSTSPGCSLKWRRNGKV